MLILYYKFINKFINYLIKKLIKLFNNINNNNNNINNKKINNINNKKINHIKKQIKMIKNKMNHKDSYGNNLEEEQIQRDKKVNYQILLKKVNCNKLIRGNFNKLLITIL